MGRDLGTIEMSPPVKALRILLIVTALAISAAHCFSYLSADPARLVTRFSDDAYYYFRIARNFGLTEKMTFDRWSPTNGFQPLWQVMLLPVFASLSDRIGALRLVGVIDTVVLGGTLVLAIASLPKDLPPLVLALGGGLLLRFMSRFITQGMETTILVPLLLLTTWYASRVARKGPDALSSCRLVPLGMLLALLEMARLDAVLFVALIVVLILVLSCGTRKPQASLGAMLAVGGVPGAVGLVYLGANCVEFGHLMPVSAAAKSAGRLHLNLRMISQALDVPSILDLASPRCLYLLLLLLCLIYLVVIATALRREGEWRRLLAEHFAPLVVSAGAVFLWVYYLVATSWQLWEWYYYPAPAIVVVVLPALHRVARRFGAQKPGQCASAARTPAALAALGFAVVILVLGVRAASWAEAPVEQNFIYQSFVIAERMSRELGGQATLAMGDRAGALAYFWDGHVLQLEGLVGGFETLEAIRTNSLESHLDALGIEYVVAYGGPPDEYSVYVLTTPLPSLSMGPYSQIRLCRDSERIRTTLPSGGMLHVWAWPSCR